MDLVVEDSYRVDAIYFLMSEDNLRRQLKLPWVSFCSDEGSLAPEGVFLKSSIHPRAYGNVARLLGKYVRDEKVIPLEAAIRRLTSLPAAQPQARPPRRPPARLLRRHRHLRPRHHPGPRHLRAAAPVCHRRARRLRQRHPRPQRRRPHRREARPGSPQGAPPGVTPGSGSSWLDCLFVRIARHQVLVDASSFNQPTVRSVTQLDDPAIDVVGPFAAWKQRVGIGP